MLVIYALAVALATALSANANIYATYPVASSVMGAGRSATVSWINDNSKPALQDMGPVKVELYTGNDTYVTTLADGVDPTSRAQQIWIAPTWARDGSDYYIRFVCEKPPLSVYTARFTITNMDGDPAPASGGHLGSGANNAAAASLIGPTPMLGAASSTIGPTASAQRSSAGSPTSTSPAQTQNSNQNKNGSSDENSVNGRKTGAGTGIVGRRTTVDLERVKFRLVFILWPALVGITMAL
ncbi:hypothetical protein OBBRIDRAFT_785709 [Obba rivulosa]|uniref:Yeast cell wall synthesis Kre9/Knh1-like N-terminal domain-containing protein n=1 Tax=Obba rivulosa TaxID=1052685 RepID=A0A8E2DJJ0_9APHY|nr:hypothetical protein OBBRIDRAFT_785709 [Obba rivulosa]